VLPPKEAAQITEGYRAQGSCSSSCRDITPTTAWERAEEQEVAPRRT